jgi:hypothetical protein
MTDSPTRGAVGFQGESEALAGVKVVDDPAARGLTFSAPPEEFDRGTAHKLALPCVKV